MPNLDEIIDFCPGADLRVRAGAPVYRRIGADLHIMADYHAAQLRHFQVTIRAGREAKTILSDLDARVNNHSIVYETTHKRNRRSYSTIRTKDNPLADHCIGADVTARAEADASADNGAMVDPAIGGDSGGFVDDRGTRNAGLRRRSRIKQRRDARVGAVGVFGDQQDSSWRVLITQVRGRQDNAGAGLLKIAKILTVVDEADVRCCRLSQGRDIRILSF